MGSADDDYHWNWNTGSAPKSLRDTSGIFINIYCWFDPDWNKDHSERSIKEIKVEMEEDSKLDDKRQEIIFHLIKTYNTAQKGIIGKYNIRKKIWIAQSIC